MGFWQMTGSPCECREFHEEAVGGDVGDDVEEVRAFAPEHLFRVIVYGGDAECAPEGLGLAPGPVVEGDAFRTRDLAPGRELVAARSPSRRSQSAGCSYPPFSKSTRSSSKG